MTFYYLDASAWVKRYYAEPGTPEVQALFARGADFVSASLGAIEVVAALAAKHRAGDLDAQQLIQALNDAEDDWLAFTQQRLTDSAVDRACALARDKPLRGADAVHLASALILREAFADPGDRLVFAVSDQRLKQAALAEAASLPDMVVWDPSDGSAAPQP